MTKQPGQSFEEIHVGDCFETGTQLLDGDEMKRFATAYDPQPIHLDEAAAKDSFLGVLAASGWHVLCASMRLITDAKPFGGAALIGMGIDAIRFHRPVLPGTIIRCRGEVRETRPSSTRDDRGYALLHVETLNNANDEVLVSQDWRLVLPTRGGAS